MKIAEIGIRPEGVLGKNSFFKFSNFSKIFLILLAAFGVLEAVDMD